jgi:hypothetical protein
VLHNQQAEQAIVALLQHRDELNALKAKLDAVDQTTVQRDFTTAHEDPITSTRLFHENSEQLGRTIGEGFAPALDAVDRGLKDMKEALDALNTAFPVWAPRIEAATGTVLALAAAIGLVSLVTGGPVAVAIAAVVALGVAGVELWDHWKEVGDFFAHMWEAPQRALDAFIADVRGLGDFLPSLNLAPTTTPDGHRFNAHGAYHPPGASRVDVHITHDSDLRAATTTSGPATVTTAPDPGRAVGRD